jgi:hypothetical protein
MPEVVSAEAILTGQQQQTPNVEPTPQAPVTPTVAKPETTQESVLEEIRLTEDDIKTGIEHEKTNVQKRIDKITAEKYAAQGEVKELRAKLAELETKLTSKPEQKYTPQQLDEAIKHGIDNGNYALVSEAMDHKIKIAIEDAVGKYQEPQKQAQSQQERRNALWQKFVKTINSSDPDFDFNNPASAAFKYTTFYLNSPEYSEHYNEFGEYKEIQAANDAIRVISELKRRKQLDGKLKSTETNLAKERMKNQMSVGNAYVTPDTENRQEIKIVDRNVDDNLSEFMKYRKGMVSTPSGLQRA